MKIQVMYLPVPDNNWYCKAVTVSNLKSCP